jgi:MATE family multidrug resistance protein
MLTWLIFSSGYDYNLIEISGTAAGCGRQNIGAYVNLGAYYVIGIPTAILLAFAYHIGGKVISCVYIYIYIFASFSSLFLLNIFMSSHCKKKKRKKKGDIN